ncbi:MAG TPA: SDR family NAD(P)-dependent oxidoreductase, partial [Chloroflexota bacterium]
METTQRPLTGKVAWITGSSRGLGRAIASHLASLGAAVAVHGTTPYSTRAFDEAESLEAVADAIRAQHGAEVLAVHGDLADDEVVRRLAAEVRERLGPVDILVNNAGGDIGAAGT